MCLQGGIDPQLGRHSYTQIVRAVLALQQAMGKRKSIVMDGRDIGTVVFPDADFKFYLTASADERARRRTEEMCAKGEEADFETIRADIIQRDYQDSHREFRPLQKAEGAVEIDSTNMSIESVVETMMAFIEARDR